MQQAELFFHELAVEDLFPGFGDAPSWAVTVEIHCQGHGDGHRVVFGKLHLLEYKKVYFTLSIKRE